MFDFTALYMLTRNDFCVKESMQSLRSQGVKKFIFAIPTQYWNGDPVRLEDVYDLEKIDPIVKIAFVDIRCLEGIGYAKKEAWVRNHAIHRYQLDHVLIVDGDEIWRKKSIKALVRHIERTSCKTATINALAIAGCPGYPVAGAQEGMLVYVKGGTPNPFLSGRSTVKFPDHVNFPGVFHFTATRRSREAVVDSLRKSCHYDDPDYEFEKWIKEKFPKIKPGEKDCHMFAPQQIWKEMRDFTEQEWMEMPESLKQYLGEPL